MKRIHSSLKAFMCASVALCVCGVWAATPVVVWYGDFNTVSKEGTNGDTYELVVNGNTVAEDGSKITIADTNRKGVYVD